MAIGFPAASSRTEHFETNPIIMRRLVCDAFEKLGWRYEKVSSETIVAKIPLNMSSYGERLTVFVDDEGAVHARSVCVWPMNLFDWGKNKQNLDKLFMCLLSSIRNSDLNPYEAPSAVDEMGESPLERALHDRK